MVVREFKYEILLHNKITISGNTVPYYTGTALVPTLQ